MHVIANWLLQGTALAAATTVLLRLLPRLSATTRYRVWWMTLAAVLALPVLQWLPAQPIVPPAAAVTTASPYNLEMPVLPWWPLVIALFSYALWTALSLGRIGRALLHLRAAKRRCRDLSLRRQNRLPCWSALRNQGRRARLVVSHDVHSASVLGLTSPAIALSPTLLHALEDDELDCVLVHEWAHVQRRDDLARLLQVAVRALVGLHPGVWWIDRQLHIDRETACDDWAINLTGSARRYAASLTKLAALSLGARDALLLPAAFSPSDLTRRVMRLLDPRRSRSTNRPMTATAVALPLMTAFALVVACIQLVVPAAPPVALAVRPSIVAALPPSLTLVSPDLEEAPSASNRPVMPRRQRTEPEMATANLMRTAAGPEATAPQRTGPKRTEAAASPAAVQTLDPVATETNDAAPAAAAVPPDVAVPAGQLITAAVVPRPLEEKTTTPWGMAAAAGVGIGRGSQGAAVATAGFFSRLGKSIGRSF